MKEIIEKAEELGKAVAGSERFKALAAARKDADADPTLEGDVKALNELGRKIASLEKQVKPVEPEDKRRVRELQEKITQNPKMQKLARAEADFAELMNRLNRAIHGQLKA